MRVAFTAIALGLALLAPTSGQESGRVAPRDEPGEGGTGAPPPVVTVEGTGRVRLAPDRAVLLAGVTAQAPEAAAAQAQASAAMRAAVERLTAAQLPRERLRTVGLSLTPVYAHEEQRLRGEPPRVVAFRAHSSLSVELDDPARVGEVIDMLVAAGLNRIEGVSFGLEDEAAARREALRLAAEEARAKAGALAAGLGLSLGSVQVAREGAVEWRHPLYEARSLAASADVAPTPIEPGQQEVEARVTVTYALEPGPRQE